MPQSAWHEKKKMLFPFAIVNGEWTQYVQASALTWTSILHMSLIVSVIGFIMYYQGIRTIGAAKASIFINLMPLSAVFLAVLLLNEPLLPIHLLGAALVLTGVTIGTMAKKKKPLHSKQAIPEAKYDIFKKMVVK